MPHDPKKVGIERPNAWLSEIERLAALLDTVYAHTTGEIWLFDNDLKFLEDHPHPDHSGAFKVLYKERIDGSLATRVRCVKILLRRGLYDEFWDRAKRQPLFENLCSLRGDRLDTFYAGCLDDVQPKPPQELGGHHPWIFYLGQGHLESRDGIVIVRPQAYPFSCNDQRGDLAIAWKTSDPELKTLHFRLARDWFTKVFVTDYQANFKSVNSERDEAGKVVGYHPVNARVDRQVDTLWGSLQTNSAPPVLPPVDCAIVTALGEEFRAAVDVLVHRPINPLCYAASGGACVSADVRPGTPWSPG